MTEEMTPVIYLSNSDDSDGGEIPTGDSSTNGLGADSDHSNINGIDSDAFGPEVDGHSSGVSDLEFGEMGLGGCENEAGEDEDGENKWGENGNNENEYGSDEH
ncbi:hypothetical protein VKT23_012121 [Stygiomarasmius scandens]|uniref:Uncharacterized protein n=1 Tax=Marasmiellus scandens TaxID=2682957 RepID=A0ABR1JAC3_9AGAR